MLERGRKLKNNKVTHRDDAITEIIAYCKGEPFTILIDSGDWPLLEPYYWSIDTVKKDQHYPVTHTGQWKEKGQKKMYLHRLFFSDADMVDHVDRDRLNYRRENLRPVTHQQNNQNVSKTKRTTTSRFLGINWEKSRKRWLAGYKINGKRYTIGRFDCEESAARSRDAKVLEMHGEFASLNFPKEEYRKNEDGTWSWIGKNTMAD